jgi:uncharacterized membrane protein YcaP (DUF421 family)
MEPGRARGRLSAAPILAAATPAGGEGMSWLYSGWTGLAIAAAKAVLMYLVALLGLRIAHRRTLAQWTAIDFAAAVAVGAIVGRTAIAENQSFAVGAVALLAILLAHWLASLGRFHPRFVRLVDHPVRVLIDHGRVRYDQLRRCGVTERELLAQLRQRGLGSLDEVRYVLYEAKGDLTVVRDSTRNQADPRLIRQGLDDATDFSPDPPR